MYVCEHCKMFLVEDVLGESRPTMAKRRNMRGLSKNEQTVHIADGKHGA